MASLLIHHRRPTFGPAIRRQRGAVLYVALVMLILMALIGVVGMQVTGLQERMSANYRSTNVAFQNAESAARDAEYYLESVTNRTAPTTPVVDIKQYCDDGYDPTNWADAAAVAASGTSKNVRMISECISGDGSLGKGTGPIDVKKPNPVFQVTSYATDSSVVTDKGTANAAVDTIFRP